MLNESPMKLNSTNFSFDDPIYNRNKLQEYSQNIQTIILENSDYRIFQTGTRNNGRIILENKINKTIEYILEFVVTSTFWLDTAVTQTLVWRSKSSKIDQIAKLVFWDILFDQYPAILSDGMQTVAGNMFWMYRLEEAVDKNFPVAIVDELRNQLIWYKPTDGDVFLWIDRSNTYNYSSDSLYLKYLISKKEY